MSARRHTACCFNQHPTSNVEKLNWPCFILDTLLCAALTTERPSLPWCIIPHALYPVRLPWFANPTQPMFVQLLFPATDSAVSGVCSLSAPHLGCRSRKVKKPCIQCAALLNKERKRNLALEKEWVRNAEGALYLTDTEPPETALGG